ncbi:ribosome recycling factor [Candidatus Blochmanniella vafra str. BVAF]|uniref:Ribosome-recycling factor n=1 Tax=Blochmanniella vafra (strain BVAF) TaxID=859654 RepID=E8Q6S8_BLOVB|nr:ribosome recycling factor [Candidatus Blochmannia vafer]ADV33675.1 ribosome recycling factor [Candidatus Blochmannia vafer str. BVAF]
MINEICEIQADLKEQMKKCIDSFKINVNKIHVGHVSPNMLNFITVEYYGSVIPLSQLTNSVVEKPRTLAITVFDASMIKTIEKAILTANLGFTPIAHGNVIRITLPILTEDRRRTLIKMMRIESEKSKISLRNIRRIANDKIKVFLKKKEINVDDEYHRQNEIQNLTNFWVNQINMILKEKELELMMF